MKRFSWCVAGAAMCGSLLGLPASSAASAHAYSGHGAKPASAAPSAGPTATTTSVSLQPLSLGSGNPAYRVRATVTAADGSAPQGQVVVCETSRNTVCTPDSANVLTVAQLSRNGVAAPVIRLGPGAHTVAAHYVGTATLGRSDSPSVTLTVPVAAGPYSTETLLSATVTPYSQFTQITYSISGSVITPPGAPAATGNLPIQTTGSTPTQVFSLNLTAGTPNADFFAPTTHSSAPGAPTGGLPGDFDEDGLADLLNPVQTVQGQPLRLQVSHSNGDGTFSPAPISTTLSCPNSCRTLATGDFNSDGHLDFALLYQDGSGAETVVIAYGTGTGSFTPGPTLPLPAGLNAQSGVTGDFNDDGLPDFALADGVSLVTLLQQADGSYATVSSQPAFPPTYSDPAATPAVPTTLIAGDFSGDGKTDLAGFANYTVTLLQSLGDGTYSPFNWIELPQAPGLQKGDFNGDGIADLAILNGVDTTVQIEMGLGSPTPQVVQYVNSSNFYKGAKSLILDVDGDGKSDLLIAGSVIQPGQYDPDAEIEVISGNFLSQTSLSSFNFPCFVSQRNQGYFSLGSTVLDLDGDGHPDIYGSVGSGPANAPAASACQAALSEPGSVESFGYLSYQTSPIPGPASVQAVFAGAGQLLGSVSTPLTLTGPAVSSTLTLATSPQVAPVGQPVLLSATLTPASTPGGGTTDGETVTFLNQATYSPVATATLHSGVASVSVTTLPFGIDTVIATYPGDAATRPSQSNPATVAVTAAGPGNSQLAGQYTFFFKGLLPTGGSAPRGVAAAGWFMTDSSGHITSGMEDVTSAALTHTQVPLQGSYSINSDGTGFLRLNGTELPEQDFVMVAGGRAPDGSSASVQLLSTNPGGLSALGKAVRSTSSSLNLSGALTLEAVS